MDNTSGKSAQRKHLYENISCITIDANSDDYELKGISYFDVPNEFFHKGVLTGSRLVSELLKEAAQNDTFADLASVLQEASKATGGNDVEPGFASKFGAAVGLFGTLQEVFNFAASRMDFTDVFRNTFDCYEAEMAEQLEEMRRTNATILSSVAANANPTLERANA